jgi:glycosyltransferase involved in cell wall biosynthesis
VNLADRIVAYSDFGASFYGRVPVPIHVFKGGVDCEAFRVEPPRPRRDRMLCVGRLLPHKGIDVLIEALPADLPLTVCGQPYDRGYFSLLHRLARNKRVEFVTNADDATLRELYSRAWANVLPSVYRDRFGVVYGAPELMGLTLLEAMACGTPAIASRVGGMPEFISHGETGFIYDTPAQLTDYLLQLHSDPHLVERMGSAAQRTAESQYDLRVVGARLLEVYDELLENAGEREAAA